VTTKSKKAKEELWKKDEIVSSGEEVLTKQNPAVEKEKENEVLTPPKVNIHFPYRVRNDL